MVVLEGGGLLSTAGNQYLQPDYLSPLPSTFDAKKCPLALLAQTCSQIGADPPNTKSLLSLDKKKSTSSSPANKSEKQSSRTSPTGESASTKLAFKPYENIVTKESRPSSLKSVENDSSSSSCKKSPGTSDRKSMSPVTNLNNNNIISEPSTPNVEHVQEAKSPSEVNNKPSASPIIRSGMEILQQQQKDLYKSPLTLPPTSLPLSSLCCPPGLEQHSNPAFRPPLPGAPFAHSHAMLGYPPPGPYLSYARVKTHSGSEALVPVCKDPYCTGCPYSMQNHQMMAGPCPSGCTQCDHQKYNIAMAMSLAPPSSLAYPSLGRPYVCNWMSGDSYCGKRFVTPDELLQHLRTHTSGATSAADSSVVTSGGSLLSHSTLLTSALRYPGAPLSPMSAARYHPYVKPGIPGTLGASAYSAFNPAALPYYSPYALYGQRLGSAAVHP